MVKRFEEIVTTEEHLRTLIGQPSHRVLGKHITSLDGHSRAFIGRCPFVLIASADAEENLDISPKGDPAGFVRILDDATVAIPERPGNRMAITFSNLLRNPHVGLLFMIPGKPETLRANGTAIIVRDRWLRDEMAIEGKAPDFAIVVAIEEVFFHCAKCVLRSRLWDTAHWPDLAGLPTLAQAMVDAGKLAETPEEMQALIDKDQQERLY